MILSVMMVVLLAERSGLYPLVSVDACRRDEMAADSSRP
jgi:hypothetical protein